MNINKAIKYSSALLCLSATGCIAIPQSEVFEEACIKTPPVFYQTDHEVDFSDKILKVSSKKGSSKNLLITTSRALDANKFAVDKVTIRDIFGEKLEYEWSLLERAPECTGQIDSYIMYSKNNSCLTHRPIKGFSVDYIVSERSSKLDAGLGRSVLIYENFASKIGYNHVFLRSIFMSTGKTRLASGTSITFNCEKDNGII